MHVTTVDRYTPEPGTFLHWRAPADEPEAAESPIPPSFNQLVHLSGADSGSIWLAATFDVTGHVDRARLATAYRHLIARHGTLGSSFVTTPAGPRRILRPAPTRLEPQPDIAHRCATALRETLRRYCDIGCAPFAGRAYLLAAIDRPQTSTIVCAFDHAHVDAYSIAIIIEDLRQFYHGAEPETLPPAGNFVDYCAIPVELRPDDPRLEGWRAFFGNRGVIPPSFPLDLGLEPGQRAPQAVELRRLLSADATAGFESFCRTHDAGLFAGALAALAHSVHKAGGGRRLRMLFPLHTRHEPRWHNAVGWFTTNAPVAVDVMNDFADTVRGAQASVRAAIELGTAPLAETLRELGGLRPVRSDIFMVSYVDYRRLPGADSHRAVNANHISNTGSADDLQLWFSRSDDGLALRARFPATPAADSVVRAFLDDVEQILRTSSPGVQRRPHRASAPGRAP
ncbi:condensation domain-containing protein [Nocardia salmonicida]|uniref:condensation domain-containing protein n=1 Tax=Nocardia salmonicida TaxID=53431 RepID=UPI0007C657AE|nr:condensation domain-containing protein [Nocardia salmonicida]